MVMMSACREQLLLAGVADAGFLALLRREVGAPGDDVHAEHLGHAGDLAAELAEADDTERLALDLGAGKGLPGLAGMHPRVLAADAAGEFQDQAHGQRRSRILAVLRAAEHDLAVLERLGVDRGVAHARRDQQLQLGKRRRAACFGNACVRASRR